MAWSDPGMAIDLWKGSSFRRNRKMNNQFFEKPVLNSPYEYPGQHWELDDDGQPTQQIIKSCHNNGVWVFWG